MRVKYWIYGFGGIYIVLFFYIFRNLNLDFFLDFIVHNVSGLDV